MLIQCLDRELYSYSIPSIGYLYISSIKVEKYNYFEVFIIQVGMETEGFAIYDAMMQLKNEVEFLTPNTALLESTLQDFIFGSHVRFTLRFLVLYFPCLFDAMLTFLFGMTRIVIS